MTWYNSVLNVLNNNSIPNNHCALLQKYQTFVQTYVNTAITTTVVLYVVYYKNLPLILLNIEGKVTLEQIVITYTDIRVMILLFLPSMLNGAECPMPHKSQSHNVVKIFPFKTDSKNFTPCTELQWQTNEKLTSKLCKPSVILWYIEVCQHVGPDTITISRPVQSHYVFRTLKMQDINFVTVNSPSATDTKNGSACESPYSQSVSTLSLCSQWSTRHLTQLLLFHLKYL